ncbi:MAG: hypothetical protein GAS50_13435 [Desulfobacterales bacterium]|jgi:hypothetical protein|nr:hypothetical protein [Desulfobacterales bacterium]
MKEMYVLIAVLLAVAVMSGCVDNGGDTNAIVEENATNVTDAVEEIEIGGTVSVPTEWTKREYSVKILGGENYTASIFSTTEPWIVEYTGDASGLVPLKVKLEQCVELGDFTLEEAQYIYSKCGGTDVLEAEEPKKDTFEAKFNISTETDDGDYVEGSAGFSVNYMFDPPEVMYLGDPNVVNTTLRRSLQSSIRFGEISEEEAQYIFEQCGGHGSVLEKVEHLKVELTNLVESDPQPSDEEAYAILMVKNENVALSEEEQAMYNEYKAQFSDAYMEEWLDAHMDFMMSLSFSMADGYMYTYIDGVLYTGEIIM